jgi:chromosome segregation ATPase
MESRDQYTVVLEEIRSQFKVFGESLGDVKAEVASFKVEVRAGFERVDQRFERIDQRFERVDQRFERIDQRFDRLEMRADGTDGDLRFLRAAVTDHSGELRELRAGQARIEAALDKKVDRDEVQAMIVQGLAGR